MNNLTCINNIVDHVKDLQREIDQLKGLINFPLGGYESCVHLHYDKDIVSSVGDTKGSDGAMQFHISKSGNITTASIGRFLPSQVEDVKTKIAVWLKQNEGE